MTRRVCRVEAVDDQPNFIGGEVMFCLLMPFAYIQTAESLRLAVDVQAAIDATMPRKEAASLLGISEADLSHQLAGRKPLNLFRLTSLPDAFWHALLEKRALHHGGIYVRPDVVDLLKGAAGLRKSMAKMAGKSAERKSA